jgi:hypothetical protein
MSCSAGSSSSSDTASGATSSGGGGTSNVTADLSAIGITPDPSWHDSYLAGSHSDMSCTECHTSTARQAATDRQTAREIPVNEICYQCHIEDYNNTTLLNHADTKTGAYCNSCHFADSFTAAVRVETSQYHSAITTSCESCHNSKTPTDHRADNRDSQCATCHQYPGWIAVTAEDHSTLTASCETCHSNKTPTNHLSDNRDVNCATCHKYPDWSTTTFSGHDGITTGCSSCHSKHFAGFQCEDCHTLGISWGFSHRAVTTQGCTGCHGAGGSDDDFDDHGDDDEYDDDRFDDDKSDNDDHDDD